MGAAVPIFSAIGSIFSAVGPMLFGGGGGDMPSYAPPPVPTFEPTPEPPAPEDPQIAEKAKAEKLRRSRAAGLSKTILTSGQGVQEEALTQKQTLLGG